MGVVDFGGVYVPALGQCVTALVIDVGAAVAFDATVRVIENLRGEPAMPMHPRLGHAFRALDGALFWDSPTKYFVVHREPRADVERVLRSFFGEERYARTLSHASLFGTPRNGCAR